MYVIGFQWNVMVEPLITFVKCYTNDNKKDNQIDGELTLGIFSHKFYACIQTKKKTPNSHK